MAKSSSIRPGNLELAGADANMAGAKLAETTDFYRVAASLGLDSKQRVALGQYMTPLSIGRFMASLFSATRGDVHVLDPGVGVGSLATAFAERVCAESVRPDSVRFVCYEVDAELSTYLDGTLGQVEPRCRDARGPANCWLKEKDWLLLVESVSSHGPVDAKRHNELAELFSSAILGMIYVTAFPDRTVMGRYLADISCETEE